MTKHQAAIARILIPLPSSPLLLVSVILIGLVVLVAVAGAVSIQIVRPEKDNTALFASIFGTIPPTIAAILALVKIGEAQQKIEETQDDVKDIQRGVKVTQNGLEETKVRLDEAVMKLDDTKQVAQQVVEKLPGGGA